MARVKRAFFVMHSWIELSRHAFAHNVQIILRITKAQRIAFVIKSNAYGHGLRQMILLAQEQPAISMLCVAGIAEGLAARACGSTKDILVMSYYDAPLQEALDAGLILAVFSFESLKQVGDYGKATHQFIKIHIKIDTGMSRLGFLPSELNQVLILLKNYPTLTVDGIFSHACDTTNSDLFFAYQQKALFDQIIPLFPQKMLKNIHFHASGLMHFPPDYSFPRIGGALYGLYKSEIHRQRCLQQSSTDLLKPVLSWHAPVLADRSRSHLIVPVGIEDGLPSAIKNKMSLWIGNDCWRFEKVEHTYCVLRCENPLPQMPRVLSLIDERQPLMLYQDATGHLVNELLALLSPTIQRVIV